MKALVFLSVNKWGAIAYLNEQAMDKKNRECELELHHLISDIGDLGSEFEWGKIKPQKAGCYQAVVEYRQTAIDDYRLDVISCTPLMLI